MILCIAIIEGIVFDRKNAAQLWLSNERIAWNLDFLKVIDRKWLANDAVMRIIKSNPSLWLQMTRRQLCGNGTSEQLVSSHLTASCTCRRYDQCGPHKAKVLTSVSVKLIPVSLKLPCWNNCGVLFVS